MTTDTPQAVSIPPYVIRLERELAAKTEELEQARLERDEAVEANHSVAVCAEHTAEITVGECVVCCAESAEAKLAEAQAVLQNPDMWMRWCDNKVLERCESAEARLQEAELRLAESAREYERQNSLLREAERDAARYRWLRGNGAIISRAADIPVHKAEFGIGLDAAIDAQGKP